jgi:hypothetical protein
MRRRTQAVDFGPLALEIADQSGIFGGWSEPLGAANSSDAIKLKRLMGGKAPGSSSLENLFLPEGDNAGEVTTSFGQILHFRPQALQILKLAASVARASSPISTSIKLRLAQDLLPSTELTVDRQTSGISFDLHVSDPSVLSSLTGIVEDLVLELGQYLDTPIRMRIFRDVETTPEVSAAWHWDPR